jgi:hypothetical protein
MNWYKISQYIKSKEFKEWFGDWEPENAYSSRSDKPIPSSVTNLDRSPRKMYHGTTNYFEDFEVGRDAYNSNLFGSWKTNRNAIFFTPDPNDANAFTSIGGETIGGNIRPVYLNIRSPLDFRDGVTFSHLEEFSEVGINIRWLINFDWGHLDGEDGKLFVDAAKKLGYDGVIFYDENPETREEMETWAVFDSSQIKSIYIG